MSRSKFKIAVEQECGSHFVCVCLLLMFFITQNYFQTCHGVVIETAYSMHPIKYNNCDTVRFPEERFVTCLCLDGIWAFYISNLDGKKHWKILGGGRSHSKITDYEQIPDDEIDQEESQISRQNTNECYELGEWVSRAKRISSSPEKSVIRKLEGNLNEFVVLNGQSWEVKVFGEKYQKQIICLQGTVYSRFSYSSYCRYRIDRKIAHIPLSESSFKGVKYCSIRSTVVKAEECRQLLPSSFDDQSNVCFLEVYKDAAITKDSNTTLDSYSYDNLNDEKIRGYLIDERRQTTNLVRRKRESLGAANSIHNFNEDLSGEEKVSKVVGDKQILESILTYIKTAISNYLLLSASKMKSKGIGPSLALKATKPPTPIQTILYLTRDVAKKTCKAVNEDTFGIALNSFITQQRDRNHLKEPYINYASFIRIRAALEKCKNDAKPFPFIVTNDAGCNPKTHKKKTNRMKSTLQSFTSDTIRKSGRNLTLPSLPLDSIADVKRFEPIIEIVWKTFISAHSYCYPYFSDYFNDHHTFTVGVMTYFSNKIQDMWYLDANSHSADSSKKQEGRAAETTTTTTTTTTTQSPEGYVSQEPYKTEKMWYGNLLGDVGKLLKDMDRCYQASRITGDEHPSYVYPWFMKRPPRDNSNEWRRKKRDTSYATMEDISNIDCP